MGNGTTNRVVPVVKETSTFAELARFLSYSFQESDCELVERILANREKGLIDELDKMRRDRDILVTERYAIQKNLELELEKSRNYETMLKQEQDAMEKDLSLVSVEKLKVENELKKQRRELEDKIEILERVNSELKSENELIKESLCKRIKLAEKEVNQLKGAYEGVGNGVEMGGVSPETSSMDYSASSGTPDSLKRVSNLEFSQRKIHPEICLDKYEVSGSEQSSSQEKALMDELDKMRRERDLLVTERDGILRSLTLELGKSRDCETVLKRERDIMEKNVSLASIEKLKVENEFKKHRREFEDKIEILERENSELKKEIELYKDTLCKRIKSVEKEVSQWTGASGGVVSGYETSGFSPDPSCMYYSATLANLDLHKRVSNLEFTQRKIHSETGIYDEYAVSGSEQSSKHSPQVESKCSEERTTDVRSGEFEGVQGTRWKTRVDMFSALRNDPELCMSAVCALYRRHISAVKPTDNIGFRSFDIASGTAAAKYLINNDLSNRLSRSVSEVQRDSPSTLETCWKIATKYLAQLFEMYQKKLDPFFCPES